MKKLLSILMLTFIAIILLIYKANSSLVLAEDNNYALFDFVGETIDDNKIKITVKLSSNPGFSNGTFKLAYNRKYLTFYDYELADGSFPELTSVLTSATGIMSNEKYGVSNVKDAVAKWNELVDKGEWKTGDNEQSSDFYFDYAGVEGKSAVVDKYTGDVAYLYFEIKDKNINFTDHIYYDVQSIANKDGQIEYHTGYAEIKNEKNKSIEIISRDKDGNDNNNKTKLTVLIVALSTMGASGIAYAVVKIVKKLALKAGKHTLTKL